MLSSSSASPIECAQRQQISHLPIYMLCLAIDYFCFLFLNWSNNNINNFPDSHHHSTVLICSYYRSSVRPFLTCECFS